MPILVRGAKQVRAVELTLGGTLSKAAAKRPRAGLQREVKERCVRRGAHWARADPLFAKARAPLVELLKMDKRTEASARALRKAFSRQFKQPLSKQTRGKAVHFKNEPRVNTFPYAWVKFPPYDDYYVHTFGGASAASDVYTGKYGLTAVGRSGWAGAGVAVNFLATDDNPSQRFEAGLDFEYSWFDWSALDTAHNNGSTNIWIWGFAEDRWVCQSQSFNPQWSDGTSWYEQHGSGGDGSPQHGHEAIEVFFPAFANNWYQAWVWSEGQWDGGEAYSGATQVQNMSMPWVVFGTYG